MKTILFILALTVSVSTAISCKAKKGATAPTSSSSSTPGVSGTIAVTSMETTNTSTSTSQGAHAGKVSHKYRAGGCETVIIINAHDDVAEITLIPKDKLNKDIDVDGQTITFDYHPLKMPQPAGCTVGIPAEISNITKLK